MKPFLNFLFAGALLAATALAANVQTYQLPTTTALQSGDAVGVEQLVGGVYYDRHITFGNLCTSIVLPGSQVTGAYTASNLTLSSGKILGRATAGTGQAEELAADATLTLTAGTFGVNNAGIAPVWSNITSNPVTVAAGKTFTDNNTLTLTGTDGSTVSFGAGGTVAYTSNSLSVFAATTSAQLAGVMSDETGTGALVFGTSPTLVTPTLGAATATSINGLTITSGTGTLTIANGKTLTINNSLGFNGLDGATWNLPAENGGTLISTDDTQTVAAKTFANCVIDLTNSGNTVTLQIPETGGVTTRALTAKVLQQPRGSKDFGAVVDGTTDDTAALQHLFDSKQMVMLPNGTSALTDALNMSTVGQNIGAPSILGGGGTGALLLQTVSGKDGIHWYTTTDGYVSGPHASYATLHDLDIRRTTNLNTGIGIDLGSDGTYSGDYNRLSNIYVRGFETQLHLKSEGNVTMSGVNLYGNNDLTHVSDYGMKIEGGSSNSYFIQGLGVSGCGIGLDIATPGIGNVFFLQDFGGNNTSVKEEVAGAGGIFIGGNHDSYRDRMFDLHGDSGNVIIDPGSAGGGSAGLEPYLLNGSNLIFVGHSYGGNFDGLMDFRGEGHVSLSPYIGLDTFGAANPIKWHQSIWPSVYDNGSPGAVDFLRGMIFQKIARNGQIVGPFTGTASSATLTFTKTTAAAASSTSSTTLVILNDEFVVAGASISGTGIPGGTTISSVSGTTLTLSAAATVASGTTLTISIAHGLSVGNLVRVASAGNLPTGLAADTDYYVVSTPTTTTLTLSATSGGSAITMSGNGTGTMADFANTWAGGDGLVYERMDSTGHMVADDLANSAMLEKNNTWREGQEFSDTTSGKPAVQVDNLLNGGDSNQQGAFVSYASRANSPTENVADITLRTHDYNVGEQVFIAQNRDASVVNRLMYLGHGSASGAGYVSFAQHVNFLGTVTSVVPIAPPPSGGGILFAGHSGNYDLSADWERYVIGDWSLNIGASGNGTPTKNLIYVDGVGNKTTIGHNAASQPSGSDTLNVEGTATIAGILKAGAQMRLHGYTVATLPAASAGDIVYVTDATQDMTNVGITVTGSGSNTVPVFYDGTNWKVW